MRLKKLLPILTVGFILLGACAAPSVPPIETTTEVTSHTEPTQDLADEAQATLPGTEATTEPSQSIVPYNGPIIDAHSQVDEYVELKKIIQLMDSGGVAGTILSTRGTLALEDLISFAANHPRRIIPALRTKGFMQKTDIPYHERLRKQVSMYQFGGMAEVLMYHIQKGELAPEVIVQPDDERVQAAIDIAVEKNWPFIAHIEFAAAGSQREEFMTKFEALLLQYPDHPFVLIHMGQLDSAGVRRLIETYPNIYFITAHSNGAIDYPHFWPGTNMFYGEHLAADWKQLMVEYPDRFILGFDNVFAGQWGEFYLEQIRYWREAVRELPLEVAHAFAHGNAERLWRLKLMQ